MKIYRLLAALVALALSISIFAIPASAEEDHEHIEIIFLDDNISDETKERISECLLNDECDCHEDGIAAYGLICNVAGHNLESTTALKIKHKMYDTAPRCLEQTIKAQTCTRCDYHTSTVISSQRINCCA